jgi:hypothetical protein
MYEVSNLVNAPSASRLYGRGQLAAIYPRGRLVATIAVTFWYTWLFNHTGGSVLMVIVAYSAEGIFQVRGGVIYSLIKMGVWCAVAIGLVVFDWQFWRAPAPDPARVQPAYEGEPRVR